MDHPKQRKLFNRDINPLYPISRTSSRINGPDLPNQDRPMVESHHVPAVESTPRYFVVSVDCSGKPSLIESTSSSCTSSRRGSEPRLGTNDRWISRPSTISSQDSGYYTDNHHSNARCGQRSTHSRGLNDTDIAEAYWKGGLQDRHPRQDACSSDQGRYYKFTVFRVDA
jgi:hypothetical protein